MAAEQPSASERRDVRPIVAPRSSNRAALLFASVATLAAGLLFYTLENRRAASTIADLSLPVTRTSDAISSPPALEIPNDIFAYTTPSPPPRAALTATDPSAPRETAAARRGLAASAYAPVPQMLPFPPRSAASDPLNNGLGPVDNATPAVVFNSTPNGPGSPMDAAGAGKQAERVTATRFKNPATTIPKGSVIQAVLETALDSTRAGFARAIVSRDTFGFDGTEILIPRGSKLVGEYKADLVAGQKRALIQWQRLMRPDGVMIELDSPAADPLGGAGVQGKVNSHFLERFSGAILQSALEIGVQLATRRVSQNSVVVAVPGSLQGVTAVQPERVQPTLKVRQGTSVSVFVSRDLDFTSMTQ